MNVTVEIERRNSDPVKPEWECLKCHAHAKLADVRDNLMVCPSCGFHARISARERIRQLVDDDSFRELWTNVRTLDPLGFTDLETYPERVREAQAKTGLNEAIVTGLASIDGSSVRARRDGLRLHGRQHGQRGRREAVAHRRAGRRRGPATRGSVQLRRRAHAGGHPQPHADGQDELRRRPDQRSHGAVRGRARRPVHRRRRRELRVAGRHLHRRARRAALLHRAARDRRDDARGAPQGLRQRRAQPGTGPSRRRGRTQGPARQDRQLPATSGRG